MKIQNLEAITRAGRDNIVQIISRRIPLKGKGNQFKGSCPFHQERTPSFTVNPVKGMFYCFGCQTGGDAVKFIKEFEKVEFREAAEIVAGECGILVEYEQRANLNEAPKPDEIPRALLFAAVAAAAEHYHAQIFEDRNKKALEYMLVRGFNQTLLRKYKIGYSCGNSVSKIADGVQLTEKVLIEAGILSTPKEGSQDQTPYDPLHGRVIIPICDNLGRPVAFTARAIEAKEDTAKYINTRDTRIFHKGEILFGYHQAKEMLRLGKIKEIYILEGQLKVIANIEAGFASVAAGGTGFSDRQAALVNALEPQRVFIALDPDAAGIKAAVKLAPALRNLSIDTKAAQLQLPDGATGKMDTDDLLAKGLPIAWQTSELVTWMYKTFCPGDTVSPTDALTISKVIIPLIRQHPNPAVAELEIKILSTLSGISVESLSDIEIPETPDDTIPEKTAADPATPTQSFSTKMTPARYLCGLLLQDHEYDHFYADGTAWFASVIDFLHLPLKVIEALQKVAKIKTYSVQFDIPVASAIEAVCNPEDIPMFLYWHQTVNTTPSYELIIQLQEEILKIKA